MTHSIAEIAAALGLDCAGDAALRVAGPAHPAQAGPGDLAVAMDPRHAEALAQGAARAAILAEGAPWRDLGLAAAIFAPRPRYALHGLTARFAPPLHAPAGVHETAVIDPSAELGAGARIGPFVVIGPGARIGPRARLLAHVSIGAQAALGADALLHPGVRIGERCTIGDRFIAQPGAVVGGDGFSYVTPETGAAEAARARGASDVSGEAATVHARIHSLGAVRIGDDVELGAGATLDRGTLADTAVGDGTKIDNQVQLGHNVRVGAHCLLCAQVGVAGSAVIGDRVVLGGQAGVADHVRIGDDSVVAAAAGVGSDVKPRSVMMGAPALKREEFHRMTLALRRLPRLVERLRGGG